MSISPARTLAFDILMRVERESSYAAELLHAESAAHLSRQDHALATELVMGVVRWRSRLDHYIGQVSSQKLAKLDLEVLTALRMGAYQIAALTRIPARASIYESVELVKRARKRSSASFVNAVLRRVAERKIALAMNEIAHSSEELAASLAHPQWLVNRWIREYGLTAARSICEFGQQVPATAIRLRTPEAEATLIAEGIELAPGAILGSARRVQRGDVTAIAAFRNGEVTIQDEGSQLVAALVGQGTRMLDCCAAPGGKTRALADRNPAAKIVAVELHPHRARLLRHLQAGSASGRIQIASADARDLPFVVQFDRILADVPCSGTGTLARNPEIKWRLQESDLADLHERQCAILRSAASHLEPGGRLVYSSCSLEPEENERVVETILQENNALRIHDCRIELERLLTSGELISPTPKDLTRGPFLRTLPGVHPCDGFFAAIVEKS